MEALQDKLITLKRKRKNKKRGRGRYRTEIKEEVRYKNILPQSK
jgi:hypothetical protein